MKGEVQREQQMSKHWPLWWQRLRLELKEMPSCRSPPPLKAATPCPPTRTHTHFVTSVAALTDRLTMAMIQVTWSVCHLRILQSPKLPCIHSELWKPSKCVACGRYKPGGSYTEVTGKAPNQMSHCQTCLGGFTLMRTVAYCFESSCISITSHVWNIPWSL